MKFIDRICYALTALLTWMVGVMLGVSTSDSVLSGHMLSAVFQLIAGTIFIAGGLQFIKEMLRKS